MQLTIEQLLSIMPTLAKRKEKAESYLPLLTNAMQEFEINTPLRVAAFLAQLACESAQLTAFEEYASGKAYEGRKDLGNVQVGDGVRYKGRGPIQLTGRNNYRLAGQALGIDLEKNPTLAATPQVGFRIAGWFWKTHKLNQLAEVENFDEITHRINGGYNGKAIRDSFYKQAKQVLAIE